jgi:hypothetical protein
MNIIMELVRAKYAEGNGVTKEGRNHRSLEKIT